MSEVFKNVPAGWRFNSCDHSIPELCTVTLVRDEAGKKEWHALPDEAQDKVALYVSGQAKDFDRALYLAVEKARSAHELPLIEVGA